MYRMNRRGKYNRKKKYSLHTSKVHILVPAMESMQLDRNWSLIHKWPTPVKLDVAQQHWSIHSRRIPAKWDVTLQHRLGTNSSRQLRKFKHLHSILEWEGRRSYSCTELYHEYNRVTIAHNTWACLHSRCSAVKGALTQGKLGMLCAQLERTYISGLFFVWIILPQESFRKILIPKSRKW